MEHVHKLNKNELNYENIFWDFIGLSQNWDFLDYQAINMALTPAHLIVEIIPTIKKDDLILTAHKMKFPVNDFLEYVGKSAEHYRFVHTH